MFLINFNLWHWSCACVGIDIEWSYYVHGTNTTKSILCSLWT